jgi:hypothetical protein
MIASESESHTRTHTTKRLARRACPRPPCSLARDLYARRTRTCCRTQHPLQPAALAFVSYGFVLVRVRVRSAVTTAATATAAEKPALIGPASEVADVAAQARESAEAAKIAAGEAREEEADADNELAVQT